MEFQEGFFGEPQLSQRKLPQCPPLTKGAQTIRLGSKIFVAGGCSPSSTMGITCHDGLYEIDTALPEPTWEQVLTNDLLMRGGAGTLRVAPSRVWVLGGSHGLQDFAQYPDLELHLSDPCLGGCMNGGTCRSGVCFMNTMC